MQEPAWLRKHDGDPRVLRLAQVRRGEAHVVVDVAQRLRQDPAHRARGVGREAGVEQRGGEEDEGWARPWRGGWAVGGKTVLGVEELERGDDAVGGAAREGEARLVDVGGDGVEDGGAGAEAGCQEGNVGQFSGVD